MERTITNQPHISVCICTFKRPLYLKRLLATLGQQRTDGRFTYSVVVADNDKLQSAKPVVVENRWSVETTYRCEPEQNIAAARNAALAAAKGDFVAFIDDDEFPVDDWLLNLFQAQLLHEADGVLGPVKPHFDETPPTWLVRSRFCERPEHRTGLVLDWQETRTGNVLLKRAMIEGVKEPFDSRFAGGGEDCDFFRRMIAKGRVFKWCNEAVVYEVVPPSRWKKSYYLRRALLQGQNNRHWFSLRAVVKSLVAVPAYVLALPFALLAGQHRFMKILVKLCSHVGQLAGLVGLRPMGEKYLASNG
jgi:glycosyltransferase involved in cell wall biosynthesis